MYVTQPNFEKRGGLLTVVTQDMETKQVLMVAYTDKAGYLETLKTGNAVYFSTSRNKRWMKGEESGNVLKVCAITIDCDGDALIYFVKRHGARACHTEAISCFYRVVCPGHSIIARAPKATRKDDLVLMPADVHPDMLGMSKLFSAD
jgi:phosphoribosyl-AMP cyclohydrolase